MSRSATLILCGGIILGILVWLLWDLVPVAALVMGLAALVAIGPVSERQA